MCLYKDVLQKKKMQSGPCVEGYKLNPGKRFIFEPREYLDTSERVGRITMFTLMNERAEIQMPKL